MSPRITTAIAAALLATAATAEPAVIDADAWFPEGPFVRDGVLTYVEYARGTVKTWDGTTLSTLWEQEGCGPSAVAPFGENMIVTCYDSGTLAVISATGETVASHAADSDGAALLGPNDIAADGRGGVWVTASGPWESAPIVGRVYALAPGDAAPRAVADDLHYANGVALGPDGRLYVAESEAGRIVSFAVGADGALSDRRLFVRLFAADPGSGPGAYPDGIEFDAAGNLWIGQYSTGRILAVAPDATLARVVEVASATAPNLAFSEDGATLYVTAVDQTDAAPYAGKVWAVPLD